ncbi:MAG: cob(I)yrinic acid a,c-diamide adenosyltransferase [Patescibacteria group bacterium]|nr:cob(I)yrinic acid a,c-diamide adenosyltransferase [Patescibacteria group bacterium]
MKIYTRKGDKGFTTLATGKKISKAHLRIEAEGTIDELNSAIGYGITIIQKSKVKSQNYTQKIIEDLIGIQKDLFVIGTSISNPSKDSVKHLDKRIRELEQEIDALSKKVPNLRNFILPGGGELGAFLHFSRTIARRMERKIVSLSQKEKVDEDILKYVNRLSDYLFTLARFINFKEGKKEINWP